MAGLDSRVYMAGFVLGDQVRRGGQSGGTVDGRDRACKFT
jgi:hypothetical protein